MRVGDGEVVGVNVRGVLGGALEHAGGMDALELEARLARVVRRDDLDAAGVRREGAGDQAGAVAERVHAQQLMRVAVAGLKEALEFRIAQNHWGKDRRCNGGGKELIRGGGPNAEAAEKWRQKNAERRREDAGEGQRFLRELGQGKDVFLTTDAHGRTRIRTALWRAGYPLSG